MASQAKYLFTASMDVERRIGVLRAGSQSDPVSQRRRAAFVDGLRKLGWTEGTNVLIDYRLSAARPQASRATSRCWCAPADSRAP